MRAHRRLLGRFVSATLALAATGLAAAKPAVDLVVDIYVDRPTVLAFVPTDDLSDAESARSRALAAQALSLASACLGRRPAMVQLVVADRIALHDGGRVSEFDIAGTAPLTGVLLAVPHANPRVLFAGGGPESLADVLPLAAASFFHQACRH
jgi:hypothetical protein